MNAFITGTLLTGFKSARNWTKAKF